MFHKKDTQQPTSKTQRSMISPFSLSAFNELTEDELRTLTNEFSKTLKAFAPFDELDEIFNSIDSAISSASQEAMRNAIFYATRLILKWDQFQNNKSPYKPFPPAMFGAIKSELSNIESALKSDPNLDNAPYRVRM